MDMSTEAAEKLAQMSADYQRVTYGREGFSQLKLTLAEQDRLAQRFYGPTRGALLVEEHCSTWVGNKRGEG